MDRKRELTSVDLAALVGELRALEGAVLDKAYLYGEDVLRLKLRDYDLGRIELVCEVGERKRIHPISPERLPDAPERPPAFATMLRSRIGGATLEGVEQYEFDRILLFEFEGHGQTTRVIVELFGDGNVIVTDAEYRVLDCLETVRLRSRTVAPGSQYEFPASRVNPLECGRETLGALMDESDTDVVRTLATQLNVGGLWAEELCTRAGVEKTLSIEEAGEDDYDRLYDVLSRLTENIRSGTLDPRLYFEEGDRESNAANDDGEAVGDDGPVDDGEKIGSVVDVSPVPLREREHLPSDVYESFSDAVAEYFFRLVTESDTEDVGEQAPDFEEEIARRERIVEQQTEAIERFEREADAERERAQLLYANYGLVDEILSTVQGAREAGVPWSEIGDRFAEGREREIPAAEAVLDVDGSEGTVTVSIDGEEITLEAAVGVEKNADRLYTEAKRIEEKAEGAAEALEDTREELAALEARREAWERGEAAASGGDAGAGGVAGANGGEAAGEATADTDWLSSTSIPIRRSDEWYERFRWFHTSDDYLVIGGRDADQNEELVRKYLEPGDRVFHTQAHGGPVTVLKATDPSEPAAPEREFPETSLTEAAQFAVSYSSVWKDGHYAGDVYEVGADQVSKTPESGEYLEKGGFAVRGERTYHDDTPVGVAVGIQCEPNTRVVGGPPSALEDVAATAIAVEPGRFAQPDVAKRIYRRFRDRFADEVFVRKIASPDRIQHFLPPGGSRIVEE